MFLLSQEREERQRNRETGRQRRVRTAENKAMAACGSLQHIFENPKLPENPTTILESFSSPWNQIKPLNKSLSIPPENSSSFTEIFGELHFKENICSHLMSSSSSSPSLVDFDVPQPKIEKEEESNIDNKNEEENNYQKSPSKESFPSTPKSSNYNRSHKSSDSFSSMNSESLQFCTEGLGFESSDEVEDLIKTSDQDNWRINMQEEKVSFAKQYFPISEMNGCGGESRRSRTSVGGFPPPISCISKSGKPWVCFKSYRQDGRFVLKEIRIPTQEFLHAYREDGRLKLHFVMPDDEILDEENEEDDDVLNDEEEEEEIEDDDDHQDHLHADDADGINEGNEPKTTNDEVL